MRRAILIPMLLALVACANTGDKQKDAALDHNNARSAFNSAVKGVTLAVRAGEIKKPDARQFITPLVLEGRDILDKMLDDIKAGREPKIDTVTSLLKIANRILTEQARLAAEGD